MTALLVISLLALPFAQAGEFSTQRTDWTQQDRESRAKQSRERYHANRMTQTSQVIFNADGSITFKKPLLSRGPRLLPINAVYSEKEGVCRLLGMDAYLEGSLEQAKTRSASALINENGKFDNSGDYGAAVESISCVFNRQHYETGFFESVYENPDGSVTLTRPVLLRGDKTMPINSVYSEKQGICRLFGFDEYLELSLKSANIRKSSALVNENGGYDNFGDYGAVVTEISCFMNGDYQQTGFAKKFSRNLDNSVTISEPVIIRGADSLPLNAIYSEKEGICRLFGFGQYLDESLQQTRTNRDSALINENGSFDNSGDYGAIASEITCYNGRYRTTAVAGGYLFQNGQWLGKVRRSHSRWGQDQRAVLNAPVQPLPSAGIELRGNPGETPKSPFFR
jgi:hypothetical protein